jgi:Na+-driven multidrug efflux pump
MNLIHVAKSILRSALQIYLGQIATIAFLFLDTVTVAHYSTLDTSILALSKIIYASVFYCLSGVLMSLAPLCSNRLGEKDVKGVDEEVIQTMYLWQERVMHFQKMRNGTSQ